jgi:lipase ATG15
MHIPLISRLAPLLIPYLSPSALPPEKQDGSQITFDPIHAFAHTTSHSSRPALLLHNASPAHPLIASRQDLLSLSAEEQEEHLLDTPRPDLIAQPLSIRTKPTIIRRPRIKPPSIISWALSAQRARNPRSYHNINSTDTWTAPHYDDHDGWEDVEVEAPDVTDRQTLIAMAKMASNAYTTPDVDGEWWPLGNWNQTIPFGWEKDADGLRGHVVSAEGLEWRR